MLRGSGVSLGLRGLVERTVSSALSCGQAATSSRPLSTATEAEVGEQQRTMSRASLASHMVHTRTYKLLMICQVDHHSTSGIV